MVSVVLNVKIVIRMFSRIHWLSKIEYWWMNKIDIIFYFVKLKLGIFSASESLILTLLYLLNIKNYSRINIKFFLHVNYYRKFEYWKIIYRILIFFRILAPKLSVSLISRFHEHNLRG